MSKWKRLLRHDWPLHLMLLATNWLPDNVAFLRLRGQLVRPFLKRCGIDLRLGRNLSIYNPSNVELGSHVYLAYGCVVIAGVEPISVGDEVMMGPYCVLSSSNHTQHATSFRHGVPESAPIIVGDGAWLAAHVVVTAGCSVGRGSLLAAGAVVTGSVPERSMAGGVPARVIKRLPA